MLFWQQSKTKCLLRSIILKTLPSKDERHVKLVIRLLISFFTRFYTYTNLHTLCMYLIPPLKDFLCKSNQIKLPLHPTTDSTYNDWTGTDQHVGNEVKKRFTSILYEIRLLPENLNRWRKNHKVMKFSQSWSIWLDFKEKLMNKEIVKLLSFWWKIHDSVVNGTFKGDVTQTSSNQYRKRDIHSSY